MTPSARKLRGSRVSRTAALMAAAFRGAWRHALASVPGRGRTQRREQAMLRTADDVARLMGDMKGVTMKVGQIVSLMGGAAVSEAFAERMSTLQASAPPMAPELVRQVFEQEFGKPPERLFKHFDVTPFAAASIGQVHRAQLQDGTQVAVKVQYPGVSEAISADLANLGTIFNLMAIQARGFDPAPMIEDLRNGIAAEMDYVNEAANQQRFFDTFNGHPFVVIPRPYPELGSKRVLVQEYIEGKPFGAARELDQAARDRVAEIIFRFQFGSMHRHGLFQADPHAGNYLILDDGRVAFLDFGCISEFEPALLANINDVVAGVVTNDIERWRRGMDRIGYIPEGANLTTDELWRQMSVYYTFILRDGVTFTPELAGAMVKQNLAMTGEAGRINRKLTIPPGVVFIQRITFGFTGLLAGLRATGPWRSITEEYVLHTPPSTDLGRASAVFSPDAWV
jgi:predicted unusual protein kinase regulating ubiquinone biosynthesis (AarF/ABC1/UbiB family)